MSLNLFWGVYITVALGTIWIIISTALRFSSIDQVDEVDAKYLPIVTYIVGFIMLLLGIFWPLLFVIVVIMAISEFISYLKVRREFKNLSKNI
jgi:hypothetical protein